MERIALSIKQPWATLVVLGIKRIEVRRWSTDRQGTVYVHTGKQHDRREEGWSLVPPDHFELTEYRGGLIGTVTLTGCRRYRSAADFAKDDALHRCPKEWYRPPTFGFELADPEPIPFEPLLGNLYFFAIS